MRVLAIFTLAVLLCGTTAQTAVKKKPLLFCVLPNEYRIMALQCMWRYTYSQVQELIVQILQREKWGVTEFAQGLCSPYEVFKLKKYFKKQNKRKLLQEAVAHTEICIRYIVEQYIKRGQ
uniref:Putative secreted protein n=1 Tax=Amblyomma triste TaxID=251400 RepID=A0A023G0P2_AMBTT